MNKQAVKILLTKYNQGKASQTEQDLLEHWYAKESLRQMGSPEIEDYERIKAEMWLSITPGRRRKSFIVTLWPRIAVAASILVALSAGLYFYGSQATKGDDIASLLKGYDIAPGKNTATLTLADGHKIVLSDAADGKLAEQAGVSISKTKEGEVIYTIIASGKGKRASTEVVYNTLSTARGEQYQVYLPDGTRVWLNAASSLKYPASFANVKERKVEMNGEAYFEVASDKTHPFIVKTNKQEVEVVGTHFNVSSYGDESEVRTTLLEGSVKVAVIPTHGNAKVKGPFKILRPGQQTVLSTTGSLQVRPADSDQAVAWKNGLFMFNDEDLESIMKKISRWYDVEVIFKDNEIKKQLFGGTITRFDNISTVLKVLELTGHVKFDIKDRELLVMAP